MREGAAAGVVIRRRPLQVFRQGSSGSALQAGPQAETIAGSLTPAWPFSTWPAKRRR